MKLKYFTLFASAFIACSPAIYAQEGTGGGVFIKNGGKLVNSIVVGNYALDGFGAAGPAGELLNSNVVDNFYLNAAIAAPGDIIFDDGTIYTPDFNADGSLIFPDGYTASMVSGICFWTNQNNNAQQGKFWIVGTEEVSLMWTPRVNYASVDIAGLYNFTEPSLALFDYDGASNTQTIISNTQLAGQLTPANCAAFYARHYRGNGAATDWFLPAMGQLYELSKNLTIVNQTLQKLGKTTINGNYWSSNEVTNEEAWVFPFPYQTTDRLARTSKSNGVQKVRPVKVVTLE